MSQSLQVVSALLFWYLPATHGMQESAESNPAVAPYFPATQILHAVDFVSAEVVEYFPAMQF